MGTYIAQSDVEAKWGADTIRIWSRKDGTEATADTDNIADAIALAEERVEDMLAGLYTTPLVSTASAGGYPYILKDWCAVLAGAQLYFARGRDDSEDSLTQSVAGARDEAIKEIGLYRQGVARLALQKKKQGPTGPYVYGGR